MPTITIQTDMPGAGLSRAWRNDDGSIGHLAVQAKRDAQAGAYKWSAWAPNGELVGTGTHPNKATAMGYATGALLEGLANMVGGTPAELDATVDGAFGILSNAKASDIKASAKSIPDVVTRVKNRIRNLKVD